MPLSRTQSIAGLQHTKPGDAEKKLLAAAAKLFAQNGFDSVSTRDISREAELNISLISYYYGGKEGLYKAVILDFANKVEELLDQNLEDFVPEKISRPSFLALMRNILASMVTFKFANPNLFILLQREMLDQMPYARDIFDQLFPHLAGKVIGIFKEAQKAKIIRRDIHLTSHFLFMVHAVDQAFILSRCDCAFTQKEGLKLPAQIDEFVNQLLKTFIEGILIEK